MKKIIFLLLVTILLLSLVACGQTESDDLTGDNIESQNQQAPQDEIIESDGDVFTSLVKLEELELNTELVNGEPIFWLKNNSQYTLVGILYVKALSVTSDEYLVAYASKDHYAPGEACEPVVFVKTNEPSKSAAMAEDAVFATIEEVEAATDLTIEFGYQNDIAMDNFGYVDGAIDEWVEYNFVTDSYRGFSYYD